MKTDKGTKKKKSSLSSIEAREENPRRAKLVILVAKTGSLNSARQLKISRFKADHADNGY